MSETPDGSGSGGGSAGRRRPTRRQRLSREPSGFTQDAVLSDEEVARRIEVQGGGAPLVPPPAERVRERDRRAAPPRRAERSRARDSLLLLGLVVVGLVAVTVLLPDGPLTAKSTNAPTGPATAAAFDPTAAATAAATPTPAGTPSLITLPPDTGPLPTEPPATQAPATQPPTATPTTRPTPTPRITPRPTPTPTAAPTTPPTGTLLVKVEVLNGDGGTATAGDWTVNVSSSGTASPSSFSGSAAGRLVTLKTGATYAVSVASGPTGYLKTSSTDCASSRGGTVVGGASEVCTIQLNDRKPTITVVTVVDNAGGGTLTAADFTVTVSGTNVTPGTSFPGSSTGTNVRVQAGATYSIDMSGGGGAYAKGSPSAGCAGILALGGTATCTITFSYQASPAPSAGFTMLLPALLAVHSRGRRRWSRNPTR